MSKNKGVKFILEDISKIVEPAIYKILLSSVHKKFHNIVKYQIEAGGKRLRPALALLTCRMMGGRIKNCLYPAAALEILHNYTLILDDIIDHGKLRRGKPTVWKKFGRSAAENISMAYAASIFDLPKYQKSRMEIDKILAKTLKAVTNGQIFDVLFEQGGRGEESYVVKNRYSRVNQRDYFLMVNQKTASLISACLEIGGVCAGAKEKEIKILRSSGRNIGAAFQIQDDILEIFGEEKKFGKKIGKDIMERKLGNIVILLAADEVNSKDKSKFIKILRKKRIEGGDLKEAIKLINKTNAQKRAKKLEMNYINKAKKHLALLPQNQWNKILNELVDFLAARKV